MTDERLETIVSTWLGRTASEPPDAHRSASLVVAAIAGTAQRGRRSRWWPDVRLGRRALPSGEPAVGPLLALGAGAVALGLAGLLLATRLHAPTSVEGPAAASEGVAAAPVEVSGTVWRLGECSGPGGEEGGWMRTSLICTPLAAWSDSRLNGTLTITELNSTSPDDEDIFFWTFAVDITNDEGAWRMRPLLVDFPGVVPRTVDTWLLDGEGAYDGLVAVVQAGSHPPHAKLEFEEWPGYTPHGFIVTATDIGADLSP